MPKTVSFLGPKQYIFDECKALEEMAFRFQDKSQPYRATLSAATSLRHFPPEHVLDHSFALQTFDSGERLKPRADGAETATVLIL